MSTGPRRHPLEFRLNIAALGGFLGLVIYAGWLHDQDAGLSRFLLQFAAFGGVVFLLKEILRALLARTPAARRRASQGPVVQKVSLEISPSEALSMASDALGELVPGQEPYVDPEGFVKIEVPWSMSSLGGAIVTARVTGSGRGSTVEIASRFAYPSHGRGDDNESNVAVVTSHILLAGTR